MLASHAQIQIRERSHAEVLDLAILVLRRHWVGLAIALAIGAAPIALFNRWLLSIEDTDVSFLTLLALAVEMPWGTAFVTLFLGQATFQPKVSAARIVRDYFGSLPQMFLYQGLLRGLLVLFAAFLLPLLLLMNGMKYTSEIVLLERASVGRTFRRNSSFHRYQSGRLMGHVMADNFLGFTMIFCLTLSFHELTRWIEQSQDIRWYLSDVWWEETLNSMSGGLLTWQFELAFWLVAGFFAVARYLAYLDCRIRREGWEVELKLMTQGARLTREAW